MSVVGWRSGWDMLAYKGVDVKRLQSLPEFADIHDDVATRLDVEGVVRCMHPVPSQRPGAEPASRAYAGKYADQLERQYADVLEFRRDESLAIPENVDFLQYVQILRAFDKVFDYGSPLRLSTSDCHSWRKRPRRR